jgi:hypothetical protein
MVNTEWATVQVPTPARGEARGNPYYATQQLLRQLGGTVVKNAHPDELPPPHGRLIVTAYDLDMFAGRQQRLKTWVEQGGHLVVSGWLLDQDLLKDWLPLTVVKPKKNEADDDSDDDDDDDDEKPSPPASQASAASAPKAAAKPAVKSSAAKPAPPRKEKTITIDDVSCYKAAEPPTVGARYPGQREFVICDWSPGTVRYVPIKGRGQPLWQLDNLEHGGTEAIRMPVGQGSVTVLDSLGPLRNHQVLLGDDPLLAAAALQAERGAAFWFITETSREGLLAWLWRRGAVAIVLGLLALALVVWRNAARFGPLARSASINHRSMAEQVRGTGRFLLAHGGAALHTAQLRALHEAAAPRLKRYAELDPNARAAAIAAATGLNRAALLRAMQTWAGVPDHERQSVVLPSRLELLERARRRLLAGVGAGADIDTNTEASAGANTVPARPLPPSS